MPVGTFHGKKPAVRKAITNAIHDWLRTKRLSLGVGLSKHVCSITGIPGKPDRQILLTVKVVVLRGNGMVCVRRQEVGNTFGGVIEKMLAKKLPKLVKTQATKRILLLERRHMNLYPERILDEIEKRRAAFPKLTGVHEIWLVETIGYEQGFLDFDLYENNVVVRSMQFHGTTLMARSENGQIVYNANC